MSEQNIKTAVSTFQAARVGHDKRQKSKATKTLAKAAADFLNSGGSIFELARILSAEK